MAEAEDQGMAERRNLDQASGALLEYRIKMLEDARLHHRMTMAETAITQVQRDIEAITRITRDFSGKLDKSVAELKKKQDEDYARQHEAQIKFMTFVRAGMWIFGALGAGFGFFVAYAEPINRIFSVLASPGM